MAREKFFQRSLSVEVGLDHGTRIETESRIQETEFRRQNSEGYSVLEKDFSEALEMTR
jgi:hypothetical protein